MNDKAPMSKVPLPYHTLENCIDSVIQGCRSAPAILIHIRVVGSSTFGIRHSDFFRHWVFRHSSFCEPRLGCGFAALGFGVQTLTLSVFRIPARRDAEVLAIYLPSSSSSSIDCSLTFENEDENDLAYPEPYPLPPSDSTSTVRTHESMARISCSVFCTRNRSRKRLRPPATFVSS